MEPKSTRPYDYTATHGFKYLLHVSSQRLQVYCYESNKQYRYGGFHPLVHCLVTPNAEHVEPALRPCIFHNCGLGSNILPTKMLPWRFISSESPDQEPNHQPMVLTMSLDSQLLKVSRELQKKTCSQAGFYVFSLQKRIAASPVTSLYTTVLPLHTKTGPVYQSMAR